VADRLALEGGAPVRRDRFPEGDVGPEIVAADAEAVAAVVRSRALWRHAGQQVRALEAAWAALHGVPAEQVTASSSGTAAIHVAVGTVDPEPGDEVVVPPITDFGSVVPILAQNAVPVFADVDPDTFCLDPSSVEAVLSPRTRAIIAVHLFGQPCDVIALASLARRRGLALIEDCAQAPLADVGGRPVGTFGDFGCFSLQQSKHITAGEGGVTLVAAPEAARRARLFADKGWPREGAVRTHVQLGMNYRMTEMQGALALAQVPRLQGIVRRRQERARRLDALLADVPGVRLPRLPSGAHSAYWMYPLLVEPRVLGVNAADFAHAVRAEGVPLASGYVPPLYTVPALAERRTYGRSGFPYGAPQARPQPAYAPGLCPRAESMAARLCYLPWSQGYSDRDIDDVGRAVAKVAQELAARAG
jgi:dTDP-4-amino-4,6-dideoxygalactose transaminase